MLKGEVAVIGLENHGSCLGCRAFVEGKAAVGLDPDALAI